jgi:Fe-S-cluster containining protein
MSQQELDVIPWRMVRNWHCLLCGKCCINHKAALNFKDYATIEPKYGSQSVELGDDKFYLRRRNNGRCYFLGKKPEGYFCTIQIEKPYVCKMYPFRVGKTPKFGSEELACFYYGKETLYVYLASECSGITQGEPSDIFVTEIVPEFIEIFLGNQKQQKLSTGTFQF